MPKLNKQSEAMRRKQILEAKRKQLESEENLAKHRVLNKECQLKRLKDPEKLAQHQAREKVCQSKRLKDPEKLAQHQAREKLCQSKRLKDPEKLAQHQAREKLCQSKRLKDPEKLAQHQAREKVCQSKRHMDPQKLAQHHAREKACQSKRLKDPEKLAQHHARDKVCHSKRLKDQEKLAQHHEREKNCQSKRLKDPEKLAQHRDKNKTCAKNRKLDLKHNKNTFNLMIKEGPDKACSCCDGLFFKTSVKVLDRKMIQADLASKCLRPSSGNTDYLCSTCHYHLSKKKPEMPKLCFANGLEFPIIPNQLKGLTQLEERLVAGRLPFMSIRKLGIDRQCGLKGNVINIFNPVNESAKLLPRQFNETSVIQVMLMRKMQYNHPYLIETIRPSKVYEAAKYLAGTKLYEDEGIAFSEEWIKDFPNEAVEFVVEPKDLENIDEEKDTQNETPSNNNGNPESYGGQETLLMNMNDENIIIKIAPGEGQKPLSLLIDTNAETLSFPSIYAGKIRQINNSVTRTDIAKWEARNKDRRCAVPNKLLYSYRLTQTHQIANQVSLCIRKKKGTGSTTAQNVLDDKFVTDLVNHDDGYKMLKQVRSTPAYWEARQKDLLAMIRQLDIPTLFITLSAAETKWPELIVILTRILKNDEISEYEAESMAWDDKVELIRNDPITCARYFEYRLRQCKKYLLGKGGIFHDHPIQDSFMRTEFQHRGSPHMHGLFWLKDAPRFYEDDPLSIKPCVDFIDKYISCSSSIEGVIHQTHKHTDCCQRTFKGETKCRFGMPYPPLDETTILLPFPKDCCPKLFKKVKSDYKMIQEQLEYLLLKDVSINFNDLLQYLGLDKQEYIMAIRSSIIRPTVFLKRELDDVFYNAFNPELGVAWKANTDIQFILDPYACCKYVAAYVSKSNRGMSELLNNIMKEVKEGNRPLKERLQQVGYEFMKSSEVSTQEAAYGVLGLPLSQSTRDVVYINTAPPNERVSLVLPAAQLAKLDKDSTDIFAKGDLDRYMYRPDELESTSLAEFVAYWTYSKQKKAKLQKPQEDDVPDEEENPVTKVLELQSGGYISKRTKSRVIRFRNYGEQTDPDNFYREQLMLYKPWRDELTELLTIDHKQEFMKNKTNIDTVRNNFDKRVVLAEIDAYKEEEEPEEIYEADDEYDVLGFDDSFEREHIDNEEDESNYVKMPALMEDKEYADFMSKLNFKQRKFHDYIIGCHRRGEKIDYINVAGGGGYGKSTLIIALTQTMMRDMSKVVGKDPTRMSVLLCAPTGVAAFNIGGCTLHQAFGLPFNQYNGPLPRLTESKCNTLASKYLDLQLIIVDETSMFSLEQCTQVDDRQRQIFKSDKPFGGIPMICFRDFHQIEPVRATWIFGEPKSGVNILGYNYLWPMFKFFELTECMRQAGDKTYAEALSRVPYGTGTDEDDALFQSREIKRNNLKPPDDAIRLIFNNDGVDAYNNKRLAAMTSEGVTSYAIDRPQGREAKKHGEAILKAARKIEKAKDAQGLPSETVFKIGARYMITVNSDVSDGIVNGAIGILRKITYGITKSGKKVPIKLWLDLPKTVGKKLRKKGKNTFGFVPLVPEKRKILAWPGRNVEVVRTQFALVPAEAISIHKSQGSTYKYVVVSVRYVCQNGVRKPLSRRALYVALSRSTTAEGLFIDGEYVRPKPPPPDDPVMDALKKLRARPLFEEDYIPYEPMPTRDIKKDVKEQIKENQETKDNNQKKVQKKANNSTNSQQNHQIPGPTPQHVVCTVAGLNIFDTDLETLGPRRWLSTKIVDGFLYLVQEKSQVVGKSFYNFCEHFANISLAKTSMTTYLQSECEQETGSDIQAFPLCEGHHWTIILADRSVGKIIYFDSLMKFRNEATLANVIKFVKDADRKYGRATSWSEEKIQLSNTLKQKDGHSCGVFVCLYALMYHAAVQFRKVSPADDRQRIKTSLLTNNLSNFNL